MDRRSGERRVRRRGQPCQSVALFLLNGRSKTRDTCSLQTPGGEMEPARSLAPPPEARFPEKNLFESASGDPDAGSGETRAQVGLTPSRASTIARRGQAQTLGGSRAGGRPLRRPCADRKIPARRSAAREYTSCTRRGFPRPVNDHFVARTPSRTRKEAAIPARSWSILLAAGRTLNHLSPRTGSGPADILCGV